MSAGSFGWAIGYQRQVRDLSKSLQDPGGEESNGKLPQNTSRQDNQDHTPSSPTFGPAMGLTSQYTNIFPHINIRNGGGRMLEIIWWFSSSWQGSIARINM
ncbi:hypothetical protein PoB_007525800 [Plakobranchus ocellatus]|uniref:Uncharacterized protein n=1 Tax=Plakobranchus ocellatus TaxID=259542 RepID=A0AAV4DWV9_9GAST|nr:hypothetical protein PoB_007525800 [Plakobranchus ocellatus]